MIEKTAKSPSVILICNWECFNECVNRGDRLRRVKMNSRDTIKGAREIRLTCTLQQKPQILCRNHKCILQYVGTTNDFSSMIRLTHVKPVYRACRWKVSYVADISLWRQFEKAKMKNSRSGKPIPPGGRKSISRISALFDWQ